MFKILSTQSAVNVQCLNHVNTLPCEILLPAFEYSQGSVVTLLRCGGIFNSCIGNVLPNVLVTAF